MSTDYLHLFTLENERTIMQMKKRRWLANFQNNIFASEMESKAKYKRRFPLLFSLCEKKNWFFTLNIRFFQADSLVIQEESSAIEQMEIQETKEESYNCSVELGGSLQCGIQEIHDSPSIVCFLGWCICGRTHAVVICFPSRRWNAPMKQREINLNHQWLRLLSTKTCFWRIVDAVLTRTTRQRTRSSIL